MRDHVERLRESYGDILRRSQGTERQLDMLSFVFAAESFQESLQRVRYLRQISRWRRAKHQELLTAVDDLHSRQADMAELLRQKNAHIVRLNTAKASVERDSRETSQIVERLKQEARSCRPIWRGNSRNCRNSTASLTVSSPPSSVVWSRNVYGVRKQSARGQNANAAGRSRPRVASKAAPRRPQASSPRLTNRQNARTAMSVRRLRLRPRHPCRSLRA